MKRLPDLAVLGLILAMPAVADIPSPNHSIVDPCLVLCPAGDLTFHVVVRGYRDQPFPNATVDLEYSACPGFALCALTGSEPYTSFPGFEVVRVISDAQGQAAFPVRAGGSCPGGTVRVFANGMQLATRALASPDQNGDGLVEAQDVGLLQAKAGSQDPTGDLDCDGSITPADVTLLQAHAGHACSLPTRTEPGTWGRIKTIYR